LTLYPVSKPIQLSKHVLAQTKKPGYNPGFFYSSLESRSEFKGEFCVNIEDLGTLKLMFLREVYMNKVSNSNDKDKSTTSLSTDNKDANPLNVQEWTVLRHQVTLLAETLEKMRLAEYIAYLNRPKRLLWFNFLVGLVRGLGTALGAGLLAGVAYFLLKRIVILNLPLIGGFIAELSRYVNQP